MSNPGLSDSFIAALQALAEWLEAEQVPHTIIGGVAVSLIAEPRFTQDIDALIWVPQESWQALFSAAEGRGFAPRLNDPLGFAAGARVLLLKHQSSQVRIDISFGALEFEREMIERASAQEIGSITLRLPTPEDLIITKAVAHRPKDLADIEAILSVQKGLDLSRIRFWVRQFSEALEMPEMEKDVEKLLDRQQS